MNIMHITSSIINFVFMFCVRIQLIYLYTIYIYISVIVYSRFHPVNQSPYAPTDHNSLHVSTKQSFPYQMLCTPIINRCKGPIEYALIISVPKRYYLLR